MLEQMLQTYFVDRIARTLGDPPKDRDWPRDLAEIFAGKAIPQQAIESAAEHLVRTGSKTFPGFSKCCNALKDAAERGEASDQGPLSARREEDTFHSRSERHIRMNGGRMFAIGGVATGTDAESETWIAYFRLTGYSPFILAQLDSGKAVTLPAKFPHEFDASAPRPSYGGNDVRQTRNIAIPRIGSGWRERAGFKAKPAQEPAPPPEPWKPDLSPVSVSDALAGKIADQQHEHGEAA
jgi:hypothetical protein